MKPLNTCRGILEDWKARSWMTGKLEDSGKLEDLKVWKTGKLGKLENSKAVRLDY